MAASKYSKPYKGRRPWGNKLWRNGKKVVASPSGQAIVGALTAGALTMLKAKLGLNTETKFLDKVDTIAACNNTLTNLSYALTIPQGDTSGSRNGAGLRLTAYTIKGLLSALPGATTTRRVRIILYAMKDVRGTLPITSNILEANTDINSPYNMDTEGYSILFDRSFTVGTPTQDHATVPVRITFRPLNWHLKWTNADTLGSSANLEKGYIRLAIMCDQTTDAPNFKAYTRVKYVDN